LGGHVLGVSDVEPGRFVSLERARRGDLAPFLRRGLRAEAEAAIARGATLLVDAQLEADILAMLAVATTTTSVWLHSHAGWAMAKVLVSHALSAEPEPQLGVGVVLGPHATLAPRVVIGDRVTIGASSVIGSPGFGWATGPDGESMHVPQLGGVVIEDDAWIGPLVTIDAGTLGPTIIRRGVRLDAHVHVGHNCEIGEGTVVAAQSGFAGSVRIGRRVLVGGQVGIADHVTVGDGARIAAKSGVIGDIPAGAVFAGYPAVPRGRWLRALAHLYRQLGVNESSEDP
jgi:UDP-3-O-[3-hydroxymyristoyl] glucosamine N-acyltransferase